MSDDYAQELAALSGAMVEAAEVCRSIQGKIGGKIGAGMLEKRDRSPVTVADYCSQAMICRALAEAFPRDPIVAEEDTTDLRTEEHRPVLERMHAELPELSIEEILEHIDLGNGSPGGPRFWTLDPIDGTKGFLRGEQYAIALGLLVEGKVVLGALACPNLPFGGDSNEMGTLLTAARGHGAFAAPLSRPNERTRISVSPTDDPRKARTCESVESGHSAHDKSAQVVDALGISVPPVRLDSQAKYGVVARGDAEIYLRLPTRKDYQEKIWDHAGGSIVVEEAGGRVTDVDGKPLDFSLGRTLAGNRGIVASNGAVHDRFVRALAEIGV